MDLTIVDTAAVMTCDPARPGLGLIPRGAVVLEDGLVRWVGPEAELPAADGPVLSARGGLVTPGLCDAHAHPIFGGERSAEFAMRAEGRGYLEIAAAGGGIASTVKATLAASPDELVAGAVERARRAAATGTTTMEAKTGYALDPEAELRLLDLLIAADRRPVVLAPTLLAHVVPADRDRRAFVEAWIEALPRAAGKARAVDVYCDEGAFTLEETRAILGAARAAGLAVRAHAGQFAGLGAAALVASLGGLSADHLEQVTDEEARAMAAAGTIATLLPGACVQLRLPPPPVARLRAAGCKLALGTDLNPGSSCSSSLPIQMWLACTHLGMTVEETWLGVTRVAAEAAGRPQAGRLSPGAPGDLVTWRVPEPAMVPYRYGDDLVASVVIGGEVVA